MPMVPESVINKPDPLSEDAVVDDMPTLAVLLGELPGSATAHLLAACDAGGYPVVEALRGPFPRVVTAWETWRRTPDKTAGALRAAMSHTRTSKAVRSPSR